MTSRAKDNDLLISKEVPLAASVCGGVIKEHYETIPNIYCALFGDRLVLTGSLEKLELQYKDIDDVRLIGNETFFGKLHQRFFSTFFGGAIGLLLTLPFPVFEQSLLKDALVVFGMLLGNAIFGKINIYNSILISYKANGIKKEARIYPIKVEKLYAVLKEKQGGAVLGMK